MSTRSQIGFYRSSDTAVENPTSLIYRHYDGYPTVALVELVDALYKFDKVRGNDIEYAGARVVQHLCNLSKGDYDGCGFGIGNRIYDDIDFFYFVHYVSGSGYRIDIFHAYGKDISEWRCIGNFVVNEENYLDRESIAKRIEERVY